MWCRGGAWRRFDPSNIKGRYGKGLFVWETVYLLGVLIDEIDVRLRRGKHRRQDGRARRQDWVCANGLHGEAPDTGRLD